MGSLCPTIEEVTSLNMHFILSLAFCTMTGFAAGDTTVLSSPVFSPQSGDESVYNVEPLAYSNYDYDVGYSGLLQGEEERQDVGLLGGVSLAVVGTAFAAALLGALVVPVLNAGMTRLMELEIQMPEFELPKIVEKSNESPRMFQKSSKWMNLAKEVASLMIKKNLK